MEAENTLISRYNGRAHVNVTVYNRKVLLTGEAGSDQTKQEIGQYAQKLENAREVVNEIVVTGESSSFGSRTIRTSASRSAKRNVGESGRGFVGGSSLPSQKASVKARPPSERLSSRPTSSASSAATPVAAPVEVVFGELDVVAIAKT